MKKLIYGVALVAIIALCVVAKREPSVQAQGPVTSLQYIREITSSWVILDGKNATGTVKLVWIDQYGYGINWGSMTAYVEAETLKAGSAKDSLQVWYQELQKDTTTTSYYDSTQITANFDWDHGKWKKYTLTSDICFGHKYRFKNVTVVDDCVRVRIRVDYQ